MIFFRRDVSLYDLPKALLYSVHAMDDRPTATRVDCNIRGSIWPSCRFSSLSSITFSILVPLVPIMPSGWGFGNKTPNPSEILGEDPLHPRGDAEIVQHGASFELRTRTGSVSNAIAVDIPEKTMKSSLDEMSDDEAARRLKELKKAAKWDPNMPEEEIGEIEEAVAKHDGRAEHALVDELLENSPYPEVRLLLYTIVSSTVH